MFVAELNVLQYSPTVLPSQINHEAVGPTEKYRKSIYFPHQKFYQQLFISLIRMRSKRDIKMGRLCTPGGAVLGIVGGRYDVPFFKW